MYILPCDGCSQDVTVVTLSIMGVTVLDAVNPFPFPVLDLTAPHSLVVYSLSKMLCTLTSCLVFKPEAARETAILFTRLA